MNATDFLTAHLRALLTRRAEAELRRDGWQQEVDQLTKQIDALNIAHDFVKTYDAQQAAAAVEAKAKAKAARKAKPTPTPTEPPK